MSISVLHCLSTTHSRPAVNSDLESSALTKPIQHIHFASQDEILQCLIQAPLFRALSRAQYQHIASLVETCCYSKGQTIFIQDDPVSRVLVVASGSVKITRVSEVGKESLLRLDRAGDWLDESVNSWQVHTVRACAGQNSILFALSVAAFESLSISVPQIERNMIGIMRARLQALQDRFCDVSTRRVPQRLARLILRLESGRGEPVAFSREEMAQMVGTTLFTVSRLLSRWADSEILSVDRKGVVIENPVRLSELATAA